MITSPNIVTNSLVLHLDAANTKSYPGSGTTWLDLSGNGNNGTLTNGASFSGSNGGSIGFDGVDDYVNTGLLNTAFTDLNMSLEIFFYTNTIENNTFTTLAGQRSSSDSRTSLGLWIEARNSWPGNYSSNYGLLGITFGTVITADIAIKSAPGSLQNNTWYHAVLVSSTTDTKLYINGSLISTVVSSGVLDTSVVGSFGVGCYGVSGTLQYSDYLSNQNIPMVRVYRKSLTTAEVLQNYEATKSRFFRDIPSLVTSGLVLNLDASNYNSYPARGITFSDLSSSGYRGILTNGPVFSSGFGGHIQFDGVNDFIDVGNQSGLAFTNGILTVEAWVFVPSSWTAGSQYPNLVSKGAKSGWDLDGWALFVFRDWSVAGRFSWGFGTRNGATSNIFSRQNMATNVFVHIVAVANGSNVLLYENGALQTTGTQTQNPASNSTNVLIGKDSVDNMFPGRIGHVKIYNRALSATEVLQNYNATKSRFGL